MRIRLSEIHPPSSIDRLIQYAPEGCEFSVDRIVDVHEPSGEMLRPLGEYLARFYDPSPLRRLRSRAAWRERPRLPALNRGQRPP